MPFKKLRFFAPVSPAMLWFVLLALSPGLAHPQSNGDTPSRNQQSSSSAPAQPQEKAPSLVDPAGPTISLVSSEPVFVMAAALNACGYDEGLDESAPIRKRVREEMNAALTKSEDARAKRDSLCL